MTRSVQPDGPLRVEKLSQQYRLVLPLQSGRAALYFRSAVLDILSIGEWNMVQIKDEGSHFDVPIDVLWKYIQAPQDHGAAHRDSRNQQMKPLTETSFMLSQEENMNGQWVKTSNRITVFPPLGMSIEVMEGPLAGTKMINIYTPKGNKTGIDVFGEFVSERIPAAHLEPAVRANLESAFNQDVEGLKHFASKQ